MLPSRFMQPKFVGKLAVGKSTKFEVENSENYLSSDNMFIVIARNSLELLLDKTQWTQTSLMRLQNIWKKSRRLRAKPDVLTMSDARFMTS